jgi:hypothetical protein
MPFSAVPTFDDYTVAYLLDRAWAMRARCAGCGHAKVWHAKDLQGLPAGVRIADFRQRLTCSACGSAEGVVDVLNDTGVASRRTREAYDAKQRDG